MKPFRHLFSVAFTAFITQFVFAAAPPTHTPPKPSIAAATAIDLADKYIAKTFPEFSNLYCSNLVYDTNYMKPDKTVIWRLRYDIPNNPLKPIPNSNLRDSGVCLILVHEDKSVSHTTKPQRN